MDGRVKIGIKTIPAPMKIEPAVEAAWGRINSTIRIP